MTTALRALLIPATLLASAAPVAAQDLQASGGYWGLTAGYAWSDIDVTTIGVLPGNVLDVRAGVSSLESDGWEGGLHAGWNWAEEGFFWGVEGDISYADLEENVQTIGAGGVSATLAANLEWLATARLRLGTNLPIDVTGIQRVLVYGTGGYAIGLVQASGIFRNALNQEEFIGDEDGWADGWTLGGGVELDYDSGLRSRLEYLWVDLGESSTDLVATPLGTGAFRSEFENQVHIIRAGLSWTF